MARSRMGTLVQRASCFGLTIAIWAPGDGKRRFQFMSGGHSRGFVLTIRSAETWLDAYITGYYAGADDTRNAKLPNEEV